MKYETLHNVQIPKIGLGSARLGGRFVGGILAQRSRDEFFLSALRSALHLGYVHFDSAELYGQGHAEELIGQRHFRVRIEAGKGFRHHQNLAHPSGL